MGKLKLTRATAREGKRLPACGSEEPGTGGWERVRLAPEVKADPAPDGTTTGAPAGPVVAQKRFGSRSSDVSSGRGI
jgi:hypothetical protein